MSCNAAERLWVHIVTRAYDRAFSTAEYVQARYPGLTIEVGVQVLEDHNPIDPDDVPSVQFISYYDQENPSILVFTPYTTAATMRTELMAAAETLKAEEQTA